VQHGNDLEAYYNKFVHRILRIQPLDAESARAYCIRRNRLTADIKQQCNINVRFRWCVRVTTWLEHLFRHPDGVGFVLLLVQDAEWLRSKREECRGSGVSRTIDAGEARTRAGPGAPLRFCDTWFERLKSFGYFENPQRSREISKETANSLYSCVYA